MATIGRRPSGKWRAQVRREGHYLSKSFIMNADADAWVREVERSIDKEIDPTARRISTKDTFASPSLHLSNLE